MPPLSCIATHAGAMTFGSVLARKWDYVASMGSSVIYNIGDSPFWLTSCVLGLTAWAVFKHRGEVNPGPKVASSSSVWHEEHNRIYMAMKHRCGTNISPWRYMDLVSKTQFLAPIERPEIRARWDTLFQNEDGNESVGVCQERSTTRKNYYTVDTRKQLDQLFMDRWSDKYGYSNQGGLYAGVKSLISLVDNDRETTYILLSPSSSMPAEAVEKYKFWASSLGFWGLDKSMVPLDGAILNLRQRSESTVRVSKRDAQYLEFLASTMEGLMEIHDSKLSMLKESEERCLEDLAYLMLAWTESLIKNGMLVVYEVVTSCKFIEDPLRSPSDSDSQSDCSDDIPDLSALGIDRKCANLDNGDDDDKETPSTSDNDSSSTLHLQPEAPPDPEKDPSDDESDAFAVVGDVHAKDDVNAGEKETSS